MAEQSTRKTPITTSRLRQAILFSSAGFSFFLGLIVMIAWHLQVTALIQVIPDTPPIRYNTALALLLSGLALLAWLKGWQRWAGVLGFLIAAIGGSALAEHLLNIDMGIDQLLMPDYVTKRLYAPQYQHSRIITEPIQQFFITVKHPFPGRPSPNVALGLTFVGTALVCLSGSRSRGGAEERRGESRLSTSRTSRRQGWIEALAASLAAGVIGIGAVALLGYLTELGTVYTWRYLTGIAIPTAIALLFLGIGLLLAALNHHSLNHLPRLFPFSVGFGVFIANLFLWQALTSWSHNLLAELSSFATEVQALLTPVANIVLLGGLLLALLVMGALYFAQLAREQADRLERLNQELERYNSLLQATLEATADGILVLDAQRRIVHANRQFNQIWRVPEAILQSVRQGDTQQSFAFVLSQMKDPGAFLSATQRMMSQLESETFDVFELKDGRVLERYSRPHWMGDRAVGKVLSYRDVTERKQMEGAIRESEERFHAFMNNSPTVAFMKNEQGRYVYANKTLERVFNVTYDFLQGKTDFDWLPEETANLVYENDTAVLASNQASEHLETVPTPDGTVYHWLTFKFPFQDVAGHRYVGGVAVNITERKQMEEALFQEKELAQVTLDSIGDAVITTDAMGNVEYLNPVAESLTGWNEQDAQGLPLATVFRIVHEATRETVENPIEKALREGQIVGLASDTLLITRDGDEIAIDDSAAPIHNRDGQVVGAVMVFHDVTHTRSLSRHLSWQAIHDPLTGLVNRREFEQRLEAALNSTRTQNQSHTLCYLDLDQFKIVNDTCGHVAGDELLRQVTALLQEHIRKADTLARLGGDEFGVLLNQCPLDRAVKVANTLRENIQAFRFVWQDNTFAIGVSMGLVEINADSESLADLLVAADSACYAAKNNGRNRVHIFQSDDQELLQQQGQARWVTRITKALEENQFCLYSQLIAAIASTQSNEEHYEVLLRLQDDKGRLVSPMAFIPAAERYNLMHKIDRWVIRTLFHHWSAIQNNEQNSAGDQQLVYAINLSGASINDDQFIDFLYEQFALYPVSPHLICFEITETVAIANLTKARQFIRKLQQLGCRFALDDFGSGMSSFAYLKNLPVNYLKIDGEFVKDIVDDSVDSAMVEAITRIGHVMGLKTIAEFVENNAILEHIKALGVDYAQGYGIAKPRPLVFN